MIKTILWFENNMVAVLDNRGEQIPEYQDCYDNVRGKILRDAPPEAVFVCKFSPNGELKTIPRSEW